MFHGLKITLVAILAVSLLASCAARQDYLPQTPGELAGYSDLRLSATSYRVSFQGDSRNTQADVENYVLRRAAEVTLQAGYTHFSFTRYLVRLNRRYSHFGGRAMFYYPNSSRWYGGTEPISTYTAEAEILLLRPEEAIASAQALDAVELLYGVPSLVAHTGRNQGARQL